MLMLETQYRMHPDISYFSSHEFYHGRLLNDPRMNSTHAGHQVQKGSHWKPYHEDRSRRYGPMVWHDFYSGQQEIIGTSYRNQQEVIYFLFFLSFLEAHYILNLVASFHQTYPDHSSGGIGIIAAYKAQQRYLKKIFRDKFGNVFNKRNNSFYLEISTVDGFQGREMDIIIFSCVRTNSSVNSSSLGIGFMADWQRLNVAITRAKYGLWIVGDIKKLENGGEVWKRLIDHCQRRRFNFVFFLLKLYRLVILSDSKK